MNGSDTGGENSKTEVIQLTDELPFPRASIDHAHIRDGIRAFLGYKPVSHCRRVHAYRGGSVVTLDGHSGPWFARQTMGPYSGILVEYWGNDEVQQAATRICSHFGWEHKHDARDVETSEVTDVNVIDYLFRNVPEQPLTADMTPCPVNVEG